MQEKPVQPWVIADPGGKVLAALCTCMAGLGETCTHVAPVLSSVDVANRIQENKTVTDVQPYWGQPAFKSVAFADSATIDFTSAEAKKRQLDESVDTDTAVPPPKLAKVRAGISETPEQLDSFFKAIQPEQSGIKPAILSVKREYAYHYVDKTNNIAPLVTNLSMRSMNK